jgi:hypothetical protein
MAGQTVEVGNSIIVLAGDDDPFSDGRTTGYLEFYDERHRARFPLTSQVIHDYLALVMDGAVHTYSLQSRTHYRLDGSAHGELPTNLQELRSRGAYDRFAKSVKENVHGHGRRENDCSLPFPIMKE